MGMTGDKMSSSDVNSKIDLLDTPGVLKKKINKAFCEPGKVEGNGLLAFVEMVLFPIYGTLEISRKEEHGGDLVYTSCQQMEDDYAAERLWPNDLKAGVTATLNKLLKPIQEEYNQSAEAKKINALAYPQPKSAPSKKASAPAAVTFSRLEMKVGRVIKAWQHPEADSLYNEEIEGSMVVVITNFKTSKLRGQPSQGMVLAASNADHTQVEVVRPDPNSKVGERIFLEGEEGEADKQIDPSKKNNVWKSLKDDLKTNETCIATFKGQPLRTEAGMCTVKSLAEVPLA